MFALPNSKRVRRDELDSPSSSRASSPDLDILDKLRASSQFDLVEIAQAPSGFPRGDTVEDEDEEEVAFNLFAPTKPTITGDETTAPPTAVPQTIRIRSPTPLGPQDAGFVVPTRHSSYYFAAAPSDAKKAEYAAAAVTGATVHSWSKRPCPGCAYPWKTISIPSAAAAAAAAKGALAPTNSAEEKFLPEAEGDEKKKRKRLGKNARIKKRVRAERARVKKALAEQGKEEKERAEREKRARRNREKKFKKRARDKAKKAAGGGDGDGDGVGGGDDENDSDGEGGGADSIGGGGHDE